MSTASSTRTGAPTERFEPAEPPGLTKSVVAMLLCALGVFFLLPFTQYISSGDLGGERLATVEVALPPPPPPMNEPPPPEEAPPEEAPPQLQQPPQQLSLSQMELAINPGVGDALAGAFGFDGFGVQPDAAGDLQIFDVADLDQAPRRTKTVPPVYPIELKRARIQGEVRLLIIIDQTGRPKVEKVLESTHREFEAAAITAAEQCLFETPTKDGQAVRARYSMRVPFKL